MTKIMTNINRQQQIPEAFLY